LVGYCQKEQYICDEIGNGAQMIADFWILIFPVNLGLHREKVLEERKLLIIHF
jgi:hypothetical protein